MTSIVYLNQESTWVDIEEAYRQYVGLDDLKKSLPDILNELKSITPYTGEVDLENFEQQYMQSVHILERVSVIYQDFSIHLKKVKKGFDFIIPKRMECSDIIGKTKEDRKRSAELDLIKYRVILDTLEEILSRAEVLRETYKRRLDAISRMLSFVQYKKQTHSV